MFLNFPKIKLNKVSAASVDAFCRKALLIFFALFLTLSIVSNGLAQDEDGEDKSAEAILIFNKGQDAHEKGDFAAAVKFYEEAIKLAPEFPEVEFQRGNALLALGNSSEAEKAFRRAIELRADWTLPMVVLGGLLINNFSIKRSSSTSKVFRRLSL
jgi:tetratricopeptide (TPR) repeat protein